MVIQNKKGQDLSIGTLILIVLGIVVLVILILGFSIGWQNLWEKINIFGGGSSLSDVSTACSLAVTQENTFSYCQDFKKINVDGKTEYLNCEDQRIQPSLTNKITCTDPQGYDSWRMEFCDNQLTASEREDSVKVNNLVCPTLDKTFAEVCQEQDGATQSGETCPSDGVIVDIETIEAPDNTICCRTP